MSWYINPAMVINSDIEAQAEARQGVLTKPPGSLGRLEQIATRLAGMQATPLPSLDRVQITVFAADHGVAAEGVSAFPQEVTVAMIANFASGGAAISVLARETGATLEVVDVGSVVDPGPIAGVISARVAAGTQNISRSAAMTAAELQQALCVGKEAIERAQRAGCQLFIGGEMGIANTTPATALGCALLACQPQQLAGPGTGITPAGVAHKVAVIERALALHSGQLTSPLAILQHLGGLEIAALTGAYIAAAQAGIAVLVDGFISTSAALMARALNPTITPWLFLAHASAEPGHQLMVQGLGERPLLDLGMRLGEGSGAAVALPIMRLACALHANMATFAEAGVAAGVDD